MADIDFRTIDYLNASVAGLKSSTNGLERKTDELERRVVDLDKKNSETERKLEELGKLLAGKGGWPSMEPQSPEGGPARGQKADSGKSPIPLRQRRRSERPTKTFEIWSEGYVATGQSAGASFVCEEDGTDFLDACRRAENKGKFSGWGNLSISEDGIPSLWGCRLFDNERDARRSFG